MRYQLAALAATVLLTLTSLPARADGDAARGKTVFGRCASCHTVTDENRAGPGLAGLIGRKAGSVEGYKYSAALTSSGLVWDEKTLDEFLTAPSKLVPGTKMLIKLPKAEDRQDLIAYLKTIKADAK
jgi:cytochrome c